MTRFVTQTWSTTGPRDTGESRSAPHARHRRRPAERGAAGARLRREGPGERPAARPRRDRPCWPESRGAGRGRADAAAQPGRRAAPSPDERDGRPAARPALRDGDARADDAGDLRRVRDQAHPAADRSAPGRSAGRGPVRFLLRRAAAVPRPLRPAPATRPPDRRRARVRRAVPAAPLHAAERVGDPADPLHPQRRPETGRALAVDRRPARSTRPSRRRRRSRTHGRRRPTRRPASSTPRGRTRTGRPSSGSRWSPAPGAASCARCAGRTSTSPAPCSTSGGASGSAARRPARRTPRTTRSGGSRWTPRPSASWPNTSRGPTPERSSWASRRPTTRSCSRRARTARRTCAPTRCRSGSATSPTASASSPPCTSCATTRRRS